MGKSPARNSALHGPLSCTAVGWCSFCLNLVREVMKALSPLTFEEPVSSGGMLGSIQVVGVNDSESMIWGKTLVCLVWKLGSLKNTSVPPLWSCRISLVASQALWPRQQEPRRRIPGAVAAFLDVFGGCWMLCGLFCSVFSLSPHPFFFLYAYLYSFAVPCVSPVLLLHSPCEKRVPKALLEKEEKC